MAAMQRPSGTAVAVTSPSTRAICAQPMRVMSEALGPQQGPEEIAEQGRRHGAAEDELQHRRQIRAQAAT